MLRKLSLRGAFSNGTVVALSCAMRSSTVCCGAVKRCDAASLPATATQYSSSHMVVALRRYVGQAAPVGVVELSQCNIRTEFEECKLPVLLLFHITNNPDVVEYTKHVVHQVREANRRYQQSALDVFSEEKGADRGLALKLCLIDCQKEHLIAERYHINPHQFPMMMFTMNRENLDKLTGIVPEVQVKEAVDAFVEYALKRRKDEKDGKPAVEIPKGATISRSDNDEENAMTLLQVAHQKLRVKEIVKAQELYEKALAKATAATETFKATIGFDRKKQTPEQWTRLRQFGNYNAIAQSMSGLAMCEMAKRNYSKGLETVTSIREMFPHATKDLRDVAEAVVRIELIFVAKFDLDKDNYVTLLKYENLQNDPVTFYEQHVKLAVAHVLDKKHRAAIIECVKLIRAEPKLLPALKAGGVVDQDCVLSNNVSTPARRVAFLIFEVLGAHHETTLEGRKMLEPYL
jgi:tetratricopeptide (TPR) repeat protein